MSINKVYEVSRNVSRRTTFSAGRGVTLPAAPKTAQTLHYGYAVVGRVYFGYSRESSVGVRPWYLAVCVLCQKPFRRVTMPRAIAVNDTVRYTSEYLTRLGLPGKSRVHTSG